MPSFIDLSNELYLEILKYLAPPDLGSYYCVNKRLYALTAIQRIKYQSLKRRFSTCLNTKQPGSTARLIKNVLDNPPIALYVQHYTIDGCRDGWGTSRDKEGNASKHFQYSASDTAQLERAVRDCEYIPDNERDSWITKLNDGMEDVLIALAITMFPNLTSISISREFGLAPRLEVIFRGIVDANSPARVPLTKLTCVNLWSPENRHQIDLRVAEVFSQLPSVKIINTDHVFAAPWDYIDDVVPIRRSEVTDLKMSYADISPHRLMLLLENVEHLQSFSYWPKDDCGKCRFDPFLVVTSLLACAHHSLRELYIRGRSAMNQYIGRLRKLRVLEILEIDTTLLFGCVGSLQRNFQATLPSSIRMVTLHGQHRFLDQHLDSLVEFQGTLSPCP